MIEYVFVSSVVAEGCVGFGGQTASFMENLCYLLSLRE